MNNEIIIRSVYGKVNQIYFINPCPNPKTGKYPDCVRLVNSNGDMILSEKDKEEMSAGTKHFVPADKTFEIVDGTIFNLDDVVDAAHWEAIKYCNWIAKDRYEKDQNGDYIIDGGAKKYGTADLYVERPGELTKVKVSKKQKVHKASGYIYEDSHEERIKKAKVLGRNLKNAIQADVIDYLIDIAEKQPDKIIALYEEEGWKMHLFILEAIDRGVIRKAEGIYKYDDKLLGGSLEATINTLKDVRYRKLLDSIKKETYPNLLDKATLSQLESSLTEGIPHYAKITTETEDEDNEDSLLEELPLPVEVKKNLKDKANQLKGK